MSECAVVPRRGTRARTAVLLALVLGVVGLGGCDQVREARPVKEGPAKGVVVAPAVIGPGRGCRLGTGDWSGPPCGSDRAADHRHTRGVAPAADRAHIAAAAE